MKRSRLSGFTLIELLLVIGIIAILASIVIVAVNPSKQLGDARNAQRRSDVNAIMNAVYQYAVDHNGKLPAGITTTKKQICFPRDGSTCSSSYYDLRSLTGTYLVSIPRDPSLSKSDPSADTFYFVKTVSAGSNRITVTASGVEVNGNYLLECDETQPNCIWVTR